MRSTKMAGIIGRSDGSIPSTSIIGTRVHAVSQEEVGRIIEGWVDNSESRYVCIANVHVVMEAYDSPEFSKAVNGADLVTPDGMPLVWQLRKRGFDQKERVSGPDLMPWLFSYAADRGWPIGLFGATPETLGKVAGRARREYPLINIAFVDSPPFRQLSEEEDEQIAEQIASSGARVLFVALGCPKQEQWIAKMRGKVPCVMLGIGAAVDFYAGNKARAPLVMRRFGFEWLHRLCSEPRRLFLRYFRHNPRFLCLTALEDRRPI